jgi:hypothetical protein
MIDRPPREVFALGLFYLSLLAIGAWLIGEPGLPVEPPPITAYTHPTPEGVTP